MMANNVTQVGGRGVFKGSDEQLCNSIDALLDLNAKGAVSHRVPGMAVTLLEAAADRIAATRPAPKADGLAEELERLHQAAKGLTFDLTPADGPIAKLTLFMHENGEAILAALKDRDVVLEELLREAWSDIDTAPKDGSWVILAKHGWTTDMGDLKQGSEEWKARFFDDRAPKKHRCWWVTRGYWKADRQKWTDGLDYLTEPTHWMPDFALPPVCQIPPDGWACTRKPGHDGPCAAVPAQTKERV